MKLNEWLKLNENFTRGEALDVIEDAFIEMFGEVPYGPGYDEAISLLLKKAKDKQNAKEIAISVIKEINHDGLYFWDDEPDPGIKQSQKRSEQIRKSAKKLPRKKLKL